MMNPLADLGREVLAGWAWPLLLWTLIAALVLWADARWPSRAPLRRHRALFVVLLSLPASVLLRMALNQIPPGTAQGAPVLTVELPEWEIMAVASKAQGPDVTWALLGLLAGLAAGASLFALARLGVRYFGLHRSLRGALRPVSDAVLPLVSACAHTAGVPIPHVYRTSMPLPPFSMGILRPKIVLPESALADPARLRLIVLHEMAHLRHRDAALDLVARIVQALLVWHPLSHRILSRLELLREHACDAAVLAHAPESRHTYARLLADHAHPTPFLVASLAVPSSHLLSRIHMLHHRMHAQPVSPLVLALAFVLLALPLGLHVQARTADVPSPTLVATDTLPQLLPDATTALTRLAQEMRYPEQARAEGIEGRVMLRLLVGVSGSVDDVTVLRGIGGGCDEEAMRVARTLRFSPAVRNGNPVAAELILPVVFRLEEGQAPTPPNPPAPPPPAPQPPVNDANYIVIERAPQLLPSDQEAFAQVQRDLRYPRIARTQGVEGLVVVQFVVDAEGNLTQTGIAGTTANVSGGDAEPSREAVQALEQEALRVVSALRFGPGTRHGQPHPIEMRLPITFRLAQE